MSSSAAAVRAPARGVGRPAPFPNQRTGRSRPGQRPVEARLRVVAPRVGSSRTRLAVLCVSLLAVGLVALLMLTIDLGAGAYTLTQLQSTQRDLSEQQQSLEEQVQAMQAPQALEKRARQLGMVPEQNTVFLQLPSGKIDGTMAAATTPPEPPPDDTGTVGLAGTTAGGTSKAASGMGALAAVSRAASDAAKKSGADAKQADGKADAKKPAGTQKAGAKPRKTTGR